MSSPKGSSRRTFLTKAGVISCAAGLSNPYRILVDGVINGFIESAKADTVAGTDKKYVALLMPGAPERACLDLCLNPYSDSAVQHMRSNVNTVADGIVANDVPLRYTTTKVAGANGKMVNVPIIWNSDVANAAGGNSALRGLLANALIVQGVDMRIDGHELNIARQLRPVEGGPSTDGMLAAKSTCLAPAIFYGPLDGGSGNGSLRAMYGTKDGKAVRAVPWSSEKQSLNDGQMPDLVRTLIQPVLDRASSGSAPGSADSLTDEFRARRQLASTTIEYAMSVLSAYSTSNAPGAANLYKLRNSAADAFSANLFGVVEDYNSNVARYRNLARRSFSMAQNQICGLTRDVPNLASSAFPMKEYKVGSSTRTCRSDLVTDPEKGYSSEFDSLQWVLENAIVPALAEQFAAAETLLKNNISSSVVFGTDGMLARQMRLRRPDGSIDNGHMAWVDCHTHGAFISMLGHAYSHYTMLTLMNEFVARLKTLGLWNKTLIHIGADFLRDSAYDGFGTGHYPQGNVMTLLSGMLPPLQVIGNLDNSLGRAGNTVFEGVAQKLTIGHFTSTVSTILGVDSPSANFHSLVSPKGSGYDIVDPGLLTRLLG